MATIRTAAADFAAVDSFRALFETAPDGMLVIDANGEIVLINHQLERLFGYGADEMAGLAIETLLPERFRHGHVAHRSDFAANPHTRPMGSGMDLLARHKSGHEFPVEIALSPMQLDSGRFVVASVRDITETQRARQAMKRARYSEQVAHLGQIALASRQDEELLAAIPPMIAETLEAEFVLVYLLDAARTRFHCKGAFGLSSDMIERLHQDNHPDTQPGYVLATGGLVIVEDFDTEARFQINAIVRELGMRSAVSVPLSDGRRSIGTIFALSKKPFRFKDDEASFMMAVGNIVAAAIDRLRTEEQLQHSQRMESLGQLTGGIAHDFNNLLTVISGNLQLIEDVVKDNAALSKSVAAATRATARGAELTRKLLVFSRRQTLSPRAIDLARHLPNLAEMLNRTLGEHIEIITHVDAGLSACSVDPGQLDNALLNLALNARDAMPRGGKLSIEATSGVLDSEYSQLHADVTPGKYVVVCVTDTGDGMTEDVLARAFEPFFTTKSAGKGSGLGLAMVYGLVKQSGGHLIADSEPGVGTTIKLYLPPAAGREAVAERSRRAAPGRGETVLVVEDDADVRELAVGFLSGMGYRVVEARDAKDALLMLESHADAALLFTDVVLGSGATGPELAKAALARWPHLKVLLTTGYARGGLPLEHGVAEFPLLRKPYRREDLAREVRAALDGVRIA